MIQLTAWQDKIRTNKGVSLVEVMIALVVLLIVFMGLLQAALLSIDHNLRNELRDEATRIAVEEATRVRGLLFSTLATAAPAVATRNFRSLSQGYTVTRTVTSPDADTKEILVNVAYSYRGENFSYDFRTLVRNR